jgi:hypothetical protein
MHIHTYILTYIHTHVSCSQLRAFCYSKSPFFLRICMGITFVMLLCSYLCNILHEYIHTYICMYTSHSFHKHTCIHTYIHTYIHTHRHKRDTDIDVRNARCRHSSGCDRRPTHGALSPSAPATRCAAHALTDQLVKNHSGQIFDHKKYCACGKRGRYADAVKGVKHGVYCREHRLREHVDICHRCVNVCALCYVCVCVCICVMNLSRVLCSC